MDTEIKFTCAATASSAIKRIERLVADALNSGLSQHRTPRWTEPLTVTEGPEDCGSGKLRIAGTVEQFFGSSYTYRIEDRGSQWRNYGAPHGTRYDVCIVLTQVNP